MARHYGVAIEPARPYKPQDKSKSRTRSKSNSKMDTYEIASSYFFNIDQLNEEINKLLDLYNDKK